MPELHSNMRAIRCLSPIASGTTGTGRTGTVIDRQGYGGVEFICDFGTITATSATITITILEGDVTGTMTSVADADLIGTEVLASITATTPRTSGVSKNVTKRIGYKGIKRYVTAKEVPTVTATTPVAITAVLYKANLMPTANP
jgi:hypothetical protein